MCIRTTSPLSPTRMALPSARVITVPCRFTRSLALPPLHAQVFTFITLVTKWTSSLPCFTRPKNSLALAPPVARWAINWFSDAGTLGSAINSGTANGDRSHDPNFRGWVTVADHDQSAGADH